LVVATTVKLAFILINNEHFSRLTAFIGGFPDQSY